MRRVLFLGALFLSIVSFRAARADHDPLSNNPDDYDVPKYQKLYDDAARNLETSERDLEKAQNRVELASKKLEDEERQLAVIVQDIDRQRDLIAAANQRITELRKQIDLANADIAQLKQRIPAEEKALADERSKLAALESQVGPAREKAAKLDQVADQKEGAAASLQANAESKKKLASELKAKVASLAADLQKLESEKSGLEAELGPKKAKVAPLAKKIEAARGTKEKLESETAEKKANYEALDADATAKEKKADEAEKNGDPNAAKYRAEATEARKKANEAKAAWQASKKQLQAATDLLAKLEADLAALQASIQADEAAIASKTDEIAAKEKEKASAQQEAAQAEKDASQAQIAANAAKQEATQARSEANEAKKNADTLAAMATEARAKVASLEKSVADLKARKAELEERVITWRGQVTEEQKAITIADARIKQLEPQRAGQEKVVQAARQENALATQDRDRLRDIVRDLREVVATRLARLEKVKDNLRRYSEIARNEGQGDGSIDGEREGRRQGEILGRRDGTEIGSRDGREEGTREGKERARKRGREEGQAQGAVLGAKTGQQDGGPAGIIAGRKNGEVEGLQAGYQAGYAEGKAEGYPKGVAAGHAMGGYEKGRADGLVVGAERAKKDASAKGLPEGYALGEAEQLAADLADATVANKAGSASFDHPTWENYNPHRTYPHPLITQEYRESYDHWFRHRAGETFDSVYSVVFKQVRESAYQAAFQDYANREYPVDYKDAYQAAYKSAYDTNYATAYQSAYETSYKPAFQDAYQLAYPKKKQQGYKDGYQVEYERGKEIAYGEDLSRGRADGEKQGYETTYPGAYESAKKEGYKKALAYYASNAVIRFDGADADDGNDDGVFAPGERVMARVALKNFGKVPQSGEVIVQVTSASAGLASEIASERIVKLAGQTRTVVTRVAGLRIREDAAIGKTQQFQIRVLGEKGETLGSATADLVVSYPYQISSLEPVGGVAAGSGNRLTVSVRNATTKASASPIRVELVSMDGLVTVENDATLGALAPGETGQAEIAFSVPEENVYKPLILEARVYEGARLSGRGKTTLEAVERWNYSAQAAGLYVVATREDAKQARDAAKAAGLAMDLWDTRVEGQLREQVALRYLFQQTIVIPRVTTALDVMTGGTIAEAFQQGARVYAGLSPSGCGVVCGVVESAAALDKMTSASFAGMSITSGNRFAVGAPKHWVARTTPPASVNELSAQLLAFQYVVAPFAEKLRNQLVEALSGDPGRASLAAGATWFDLAKEMRDDEAIDGANYKENVENLLLTKYINAALAKTGEERKALVTLYPSIEEARGQLESGKRAKRVKKVLKPLKKAYKEFD